MKKWLIITTAFLLILQNAVSYAYTPGPYDSQYRMGVSYTYAISRDKPVLVFFYSDNCSACKRFLPKLKLLKSIYSNSYSLVTINCNDPSNGKVMQNFLVQVYPTLYIVDNKGKDKYLVHYSLYSDFRVLKAELDKYLQQTNR